MSAYFYRKHMTKKTKAIIIISLLLAAAASALVPVSKARALGGNLADRMENHATQAAARQDASLSRIISRGDTMISVRLTSLQNLLTRVQNDKRLSDDEKNSFESDINSTISSLQSLKTKLDGDTDPTTALSDAKSIVTSYRIYMIYEPKTRLLVVVNNLQTASSTVSDLVTKVQGLVDTLKNEGKDVTTAQNALTDASTQLSAINTLLTTDKTLLTNVTISTSNPQSVFMQVRKDLQTARTDMAKIRTDFETVRTSLKATHTSPTAIPTP